MMSFAICPDAGPPRIWRYVTLHEVVAAPHEDMITHLDKKTNTLVIVRELFDRLGEIDRHRVLRTHAPLTVATEFSYREIWK